ncbi:hypothetical protein H696_04448 [Fonticula alba]|uniref:UDP-N-acetylglucosamine transporter n=1 Tax=Fonticula alba TaxID=691883 RepID=A0A058Z431_FONAL|nr:hypothetical protein H696_04448 [Fonticula alba]KCV69029.1 hypothetical protein H696_04448 [Fonticula alba]|eukprot:XP_009496600.1 hypothetical protein H696_04448 [Fonticula alba]
MTARMHLPSYRKGPEVGPHKGPAAGSPDGPRLFGFPLKYVSLVLLVIQNSALVLTLRQSRVAAAPGGVPYASSTAVVLSETLKLITCLLLVFLLDARSSPRAFGVLLRRFIFTPRQLLPLAIPAVLYTLQNNLQYVAASNLDAAVFQVTYQLKIIATALCSVLMLGRSLSKTRWLSLVVLTAGVALVQMSPAEVANLVDLTVGSMLSGLLPQAANFVRASGGQREARHAAAAAAAAPGAGPSGLLRTARSTLSGGVAALSSGGPGRQNAFVGLVAVLVACALSGFAGVYFERILKKNSGGVEPPREPTVAGGSAGAPPVEPGPPGSTPHQAGYPLHPLVVAGAGPAAAGEAKANYFWTEPGPDRRAGVDVASKNDARRLAVVNAAYRADPSVWVRNVQLALFGAGIGLAGALLADGAHIDEHGFLGGYTGWTWLAIANQALGGLLVAVVVKYADNILKGYATSVSIILSAIASVYLFNFVISSTFVVGATLVCVAVYLYS